MAQNGETAINPRFIRIYPDQPLTVLLGNIGAEEHDSIWNSGYSDAEGGKKCNLWRIRNDGYTLRELHNWSIDETEQWITLRQDVYEQGYDSYHTERFGFPLPDVLKRYVEMAA